MKKESTIIAPNVSEIELRYVPKVRPSEMPKITSPEDSYRVFIETWDFDKIHLVEQFKVMLLNRANGVIGICTLTSGTSGGTFVDPKQIFAVALKANASQIIMAHNHPSGSLTPSANDEAITKKIKAGADLLELKLLDHLIITSEGFTSICS